jgi:hypothetical protein
VSVGRGEFHEQVMRVLRVYDRAAPECLARMA